MDTLLDLALNRAATVADVKSALTQTVRGLLGRADDMCIGTDYGFAETFDSGVSEKIAGGARE